MSQKTEAAPPPPPPAGSDLESWLSDLQDAIKEYKRERGDWDSCKTHVATWTKQAAVHEREAERHLQTIIGLMRQRCGEDFIRGLTAVGQLTVEELDDARADRDQDEWDMEDRAELPDVGGCDLSDDGRGDQSDDE